MRQVVRVGFAILFMLSLTGCSGQKIRSSQEVPPIFYTSGDAPIELFQVSRGSEEVWRIYPNRREITLDKIAAIKYGEAPSAWTQEFPENSAPRPLVEGEKYEAFAVLLGSDVARFHFTIKDGKVVELPK